MKHMKNFREIDRYSYLIIIIIVAILVASILYFYPLLTTNNQKIENPNMTDTNSTIDNSTLNLKQDRYVVNSRINVTNSKSDRPDITHRYDVTVKVDPKSRTAVYRQAERLYRGKSVLSLERKLELIDMEKAKSYRPLEDGLELIDRIPILRYVLNTTPKFNSYTDLSKDKESGILDYEEYVIDNFTYIEYNSKRSDGLISVSLNAQTRTENISAETNVKKLKSNLNFSAVITESSNLRIGNIESTNVQVRSYSESRSYNRTITSGGNVSIQQGEYSVNNDLIAVRLRNKISYILISDGNLNVFSA